MSDKLIDNTVCMNCFIAKTNVMEYIKRISGERKVFFGFLSDNNEISIGIGKEITYSESLLIADSIVEMAKREC